MTAFQFVYAQVENVKQRCLPNALNYPMMEEYDFRNDTVSFFPSSGWTVSNLADGESFLLLK